MPAPEATMMAAHGELEPRRRPQSADLISDLGDDVLLHILALLPDARDAARTDALSRRWRGLWTRFPALRFDTEPAFSAPDDAFIGGALAAALRASHVTEPAIKHLAISFKTKNFNHHHDPKIERLVPPFLDAARGWITYAVRHAVKSFDLELLHPPQTYYNDTTTRVLNLDELPGSTKLETLRLALCQTRVWLPATAVFASLTDLSLEDMNVEDGRGRLLSPACCPRLRKLRMRSLTFRGLKELRLDAGMLEELSLEYIIKLDNHLKLMTPNLRVLHMNHCNLDGLTISAPRLEKLTFWWCQPKQLIVVSGNLSCVETLQVHLVSCEYGNNDSSIHLLQSCKSARCFELSLDIYKVTEMFSRRIPHLPHVAFLTLDVSLLELHSFQESITAILAQCPNLESVRVHLRYSLGHHPDANFTCYHPIPYHGMSFAHLHEVEFRGFAGTGCELLFMQAVISSAACLQKVAICFDARYSRFIMGSRDPSMLKPKLKGVWTASGNDASLAYGWEWRSCV